MNINTNSCNGSALLVVLLAMTVLLVSIINLRQNSSYVTDALYARERFEQSLCLAEAILLYGVAFCKENLTVLRDQSKKGDDNFLKNINKIIVGKRQYAGHLSIETKGDKFFLIARVADEYNASCKVRCSLIKKYISSGYLSLSLFCYLSS